MWPNLLAFAWCRQFAGDKEVAFVVRGQCQMEDIAAGGCGHELVPDVSLDDLDDRQVDRQQRQIVHEAQPGRAMLRGAVPQFVKHSHARDQLMAFGRVIPPPACPVPTRHDVRLRPLLVVEARDGGLDIDARLVPAFRVPSSICKGQGWGWVDQRSGGSCLRIGGRAWVAGRSLCRVTSSTPRSVRLGLHTGASEDLSPSLPPPSVRLQQPNLMP